MDIKRIWNYWLDKKEPKKECVFDVPKIREVSHWEKIRIFPDAKFEWYVEHPDYERNQKDYSNIVW